jgi:hypothetical protein
VTTNSQQSVMIVPNERLIRLKLAAPKTESDVATFSLELRRAVQRLCETGTTFDVLADLRDIIVVPQTEIVQARDQLQWLANNGLRKAANIVGHTLTTMQIRRLATDSRFEYFSSEAEALAWLAKR